VLPFVFTVICCILVSQLVNISEMVHALFAIAVFISLVFSQREREVSVTTSSVFLLSGFLESLWRDIDMNRLNRDVGYKSADLNLVIVSHGVTMRVFLMRWFKWTTAQFELLNNPHNCEVRVMQLAKGGEYSLLVHHTREELVQWGLSPEMIADQEWRKTAVRGQWNDQWPWSGTSFFDHFGEEKDEDSSEESSANHTPVNGNGPCHETSTAACENRRTPLDLIDTDFS
jgi:hypothetical protein